MVASIFFLNSRFSEHADDVCLGSGDERARFVHDDVGGCGARPKVLRQHARVDGARRERVDDRVGSLRVHAGASGAQLGAARHQLPSARLRSQIGKLESRAKSKAR